MGDYSDNLIDLLVAEDTMDLALGNKTHHKKCSCNKLHHAEFL